MAESKFSLQNIIESERLEHESAQLEFKSAKGGLPGSFWESYSAFANTDGGTIILGVVEKNDKFFFDGLDEATATRYKELIQTFYRMLNEFT